jgi:2-keto-4-pentenoate hydratase/2-oxohepta-3-ene-1,7-dioic acid hydratase in catechol pathway
VYLPEGVTSIVPVLRIAAIVGADGAIGGYTLMNDWEAPELSGAKATDFATSLGPVVITPDGFEPEDVDFPELFAYAARNTRLAPGDVIVAPGGHRKAAVGLGETAEVSLPPFGALRNPVAERVGAA